MVNRMTKKLIFLRFCSSFLIFYMSLLMTNWCQDSGLHSPLKNLTLNWKAMEWFLSCSQNFIVINKWLGCCDWCRECWFVALIWVIIKRRYVLGHLHELFHWKQIGICWEDQTVHKYSIRSNMEKQGSCASCKLARSRQCWYQRFAGIQKKPNWLWLFLVVKLIIQKNTRDFQFKILGLRLL